MVELMMEDLVLNVKVGRNHAKEEECVINAESSATVQ